MATFCAKSLQKKNKKVCGQIFQWDTYCIKIWQGSVT